MHSRDGEWLFVPPVEGAIVVNVGDLLMRWSNDVLRSTPHCVMDDPRTPMAPEEGGASGHDAEASVQLPPRYSMAYFCNPSRDTIVECLPTCASAERPPAYPPIRAADYLDQRVAAMMTGS